MVNRYILIGTTIVALILGALFSLLYTRSLIASLPEGDFHEHADFALFIDGEKFDFARTEFMSNKPCTIDEARGFIQTAHAHGIDLEDGVHLHDLDGDVIHMHQPGITYHDFFERLKMGFEDSFFIDHEGNKIQNNETHSFRFFVNNKEEPSLMNKDIRDLDRTLITYGPRDRSQASIDAELVQVSERACIQSGSCLHRGTPPPESCGKVYVPPKLINWLGIEVELE